MCRLCFVAETDFEILPIRSKFNRNRFLNSETILVNKGERLLDRITSVVANPFEQLALHSYVLKSITESTVGLSVGKDGSVFPEYLIVSGVKNEWLEFEDALNFLAHHNPTRMKTIEHLELNYRKAVSQSKTQRASALASLQTRQSLEMDMLTSQQSYAKSDLEALVQQHCSEIDALEDHWASAIRNVQQRQLQEYKDLVMEVVQRETFPPTWYEPREYSRPEIMGLSYMSMHPVAVSSSIGNKARLVRISHMRGDFLSSLISSKILSIDQSNLDPEEQCASNSTVHEISSAVVLGTSSRSFSFKSNQDTELLRKIDSESPADCRWPSLLEQVELLRSSESSAIRKTRHSNLGHGICALYHLLVRDVDESTLVTILKDCEFLGVRRVFIPSFLVPDLRAPSIADLDGTNVIPIVPLAVKRLSNVLSFPSLDEIVLVDNFS